MNHESALDNVVWHALVGPLAPFRVTPPGARAHCFDPEVAVFGAVDRADAAAWEALADAVGEGGSVALSRDKVPAPPDGWTETFRGTCLQLVADALAPPPSIEFEPLGADDAEEMVELATLTEPGPFLRRTFTLGGYIGLRRAGRLVAMAGRRLQVPGYREVSAVCTHPDARREGLGAALTLAVAHGIRRDGDEAFLHVLEGNDNAIALYRKLGFRFRRTTEVAAFVLGPRREPSPA